MVRNLLAMAIAVYPESNLFYSMDNAQVRAKKQAIYDHITSEFPALNYSSLVINTTPFSIV